MSNFLAIIVSILLAISIWQLIKMYRLSKIGINKNNSNLQNSKNKKLI